MKVSASYVEHGQADRTDGGLGEVGSVQYLLPVLCAGRSRRNIGIEGFRDTDVAGADTVNRFQCTQAFGKRADEVAAHSGVLASLSREHEGQFARLAAFCVKYALGMGGDTGIGVGQVGRGRINPRYQRVAVNSKAAGQFLNAYQPVWRLP